MSMSHSYSDQLRNLAIKVDHPQFPIPLVLDAIHSDCLKLSAQGSGEQFSIGGPALALFHFSEDVKRPIQIDLIDHVREGKNDIVSAWFSSEEDGSTFWQAFRRHRPQVSSSIMPNGWPRMPMRAQFTEAARLQRVNFLQEYTGIKLDEVATTSLDPESLTRVTESFIGTVEVPIGAAGPLLFHGQHTSGHIFAPMATTEGSLVASATRGSTAITASGGITTAILDQRITRVPLFQMADLHDAIFLGHWVQSRISDIRRQTQLMSKHAKLIRLEPQILGRDLHLHFIYDSGDAAGQNMTTGCTWRACHWIMEEIATKFGVKVERFIIESNLSNDKKVTFNNFIRGRGRRAVAECKLPGEVTQRFLHVTPEELVKGYHSLAAGGVAGGMIGLNINVANMVAAIFTATGQDIASVHESGVGHLTLELVDGGTAVYASLVLPSLLIGTVGGGTRLPQQRTCLKMMDCDGAGKSSRLAEIICGFALALDLSTLSALVSDEFAAAHHPLAKAMT